MKRTLKIAWGVYMILSTGIHQNKTPAMIYISHTPESCQPGGFWDVET